MTERMKKIIDRNYEDWLKAADEEIKSRNEKNHAVYTLIICNDYVNGKRKHKWLRDKF